MQQGSVDFTTPFTPTLETWLIAGMNTDDLVKVTPGSEPDFLPCVSDLRRAPEDGVNRTEPRSDEHTHKWSRKARGIAPLFPERPAGP